MHTVLNVSSIRVLDKPYFRSILPKELCNRLQLQAGDKLTVDIKTVKRDGLIIYDAEDGTHA